jgi:hypothetical protein
MKKIQAINGNVVCRPVRLEEKVGGIYLPGIEDKVSMVREVIGLSNEAAAKGINIGDTIVTKKKLYDAMPPSLTENGLVPYQLTDVVEVVHLDEIVAVYREE